MRGAVPAGAQAHPASDGYDLARSARPGARRPVFAGALASVLLGFAALLAAPQAAHAVDKDIWSATLTTAASSSPTTVFGYAQFSGEYAVDSFGSLSPDEIPSSAGLGTTRTVRGLFNDNAPGGTLKFLGGFSASDRLTNATFRQRLTLHIGSASGTDSFAGAEATYGSLGDGFLNGLIWPSGLTWAAMETYAVRLTLSVPGIDAIAFDSAGADGAFKTGDAVTATVTFSEAVTVDTSGGTPQLKIDMDGSEKTLSYVLGSGTALVFSGYTVAAGDEDTDGLSIAADQLTLNGGTIKAAADTRLDAVLDHAAEPASASHKVDGVKPTMVTTGAGAPAASSDGSKIVLVFSEAIGSVDRNKITLMSGTTTLTTSGHLSSGSRVEITLTTALTASDTNVTVELGADAVTDVAGNGIAAVPATLVSRVSVVDTTAPVLTNAVIQDVTTAEALLLGFDEALDGNSVPAPTAFRVTVEGRARTVTSVNILLGDPKILAMAVSPPVKPGETVTVAYTKPATNPLKDAAGNEVDSFPAFPVENRLSATAPDAPGSLAATAVAGDGTKMDLAWTTPWANGDAITKFQVRYEAGTSVSATTMWADIDGSGPTTTSHQVTGLTGGTEYTFEVRAVNGIGGGSEAPVTERTTDTTAPTLTSAVIQNSTLVADQIFLDFDEDFDTTSLPSASAFTVTVEGNDRTGSTFLFVSTRMRSGVVHFAPAARPGETVTVSYTKPAFNPLKDAAGNEVDSFMDFPVDNQLSATAPDAPGNLLAAPGAHADTMELSWDTPWHNGDPIAMFQVRHAEGASAPTGTGGWTDIGASDANTTAHTVGDLKPGTDYTFEVRAVNGIDAGAAAVAETATTRAVVWDFTLTDANDNPVARIVEGGDPITATATITNGVTFSTDQPVTLGWGGSTLGNLLAGAGGTNAIAILAGQSRGSLDISAPADSIESYIVFTAPLTATHRGTEIGSIDLTFVDDQDPPVATISMAPTAVTEGQDIEIDITLSRALALDDTVKLVVTDTAGALSDDPLPTGEQFFAGRFARTRTLTLTAADNATQNDGARDVTVALQLNPDFPYTLGEPSSVTVTVYDNDTAPTAPRDLAARAGNGEVTLRWDAPADGGGQPIARYQYRYAQGATVPAGDAWTDVPDSGDGGQNRSGFTVTGLTNDLEYAFEVRAVNGAGLAGPAVSETATPIVGVAVSFGADEASVVEGGTATVTLTLGAAPAAGTQVTVPLAATAGPGLEPNEYSGVPQSVTFAAGEPSTSFTVSTVDNDADEPDATLTLALGALPAGYVAGAHPELVLTVEDDDHPIVTASFGAASASIPEGTAVEVTVTLSEEPDRAVVLPISGDAGLGPRGGRVRGRATDRDLRGRRDGAALHGDLRRRRGRGGRRDAEAQLRRAAGAGDGGDGPADGTDGDGRRRPAGGAGGPVGDVGQRVRAARVAGGVERQPGDALRGCGWTAARGARPGWRRPGGSRT